MLKKLPESFHFWEVKSLFKISISLEIPDHLHLDLLILESKKVLFLHIYINIGKSMYSIGEDEEISLGK